MLAARPFKAPDTPQRAPFIDAPSWLALPHKTLDRLIAEHAISTPEAPAIVADGITTSYRALVERSGEIGAALRARAVARGARIGVCADASPDLIAAILAIWSVGAIYVPLDPRLPQARLDHIVADASLSIVLVHDAYARRFAAPLIIVLNGLTAPSPTHAASDASLGDAAYVIYTSGSTGPPKGVVLRHAGLTNAILATNQRCSLGSADRQLYRASIAFDAALYDLFCPLAAGATVVIAAREAWGEPRAFIELIVGNAITSLLVSPSFLAALLEEPGFARCTSLRIVACGGEALSLGMVTRFAARSSATLYNAYGPSEATILVTTHRCTAADAAYGEESVPLGQALPNTHVSVRDGALLPVAPGGTGEIVIGGVQLALGYLNNDEATATRFVADPLRPFERLYRTGDLARLQADGAIVFLGRNDKQVKIRGQRVEPAEVAAAIERLDGVRTAAVLAQQRNATAADASLVLVAYVAARAGATLSPAGLRRALRDALPSAMVPAEIVLIDTFPLTITGKIDEAALARRDDLRAPSRTAELPPTEPTLRVILHEQLRAIWETLLGVDGIRDNDDFYDLGGDSLLAVRLMMRLEETFGRAVTFSDFFSAMTIAGLGEALSSRTDGAEPDALPFNPTGSQPPFAFLHGDFAGGMYAWSLAAMLGDDQPMLVIPPHGMRGRPHATDVSAMAADAAATIMRFHPTGPLRIGGYSAAGLVAYEAAAELRRAGRDVLDVVIIGMGAETIPYRWLDALARRLKLPAPLRDALLGAAIDTGFRIERFVRLPAAQRWPKLRALLQRTGRTTEPADPEAIETSDAYRRYANAHRTYIPSRYDGRVAILWPREQIVENGDPRRDWLAVAPHADFTYVTGSHHSAVSRYLADIAAAMKQRFAEHPLSE